MPSCLLEGDDFATTLRVLPQTYLRNECGDSCNDFLEHAIQLGIKIMNS